MRTETISDYAEAMKQGDQFPPVVVFNDGSNYWLADGFHRIYAARDIGLEEIDAEVREGSIHDARWFAVGANNRHGARPTNEDKRSAVQLALEDEKLSQLSDREIARQCHVSNGFVSRLRRDSSVYGTQSAELLTQETPRQNWAETIQEVIQQEQEKAERRLAEERAGMEATIREQGWTQERIGKALGVDRSTISRWFPVCNITNHNSDNSPSLTPTQNLEAIIAP
mgnify:CR=1 FL=1